MKRSDTARYAMRKSLLSGVAISAAMMLGTAASVADDTTVKIAYSADYLMSSPDLAKKWFGEIKTGFESANPGVKVELVPIQGGFDDFITKLSLMYSNPSSAPDIAQVPSAEVGQWVASDMLAPLDDRLAKTSWWPQFVDSVKQEGIISGKTYYVSEGDNVNGLIYDHSIFKKAGLPDDWQPKTWKDVLDAASAIKKSSPDVWPLWIMTGTAQGSQGVVLGALNMLAASSDPTILDPATNKWVIDSKGLREVLDIYRTASADGLLAPPSQLLNANAPGNVAPFIPKHQIGITLGGNYVPQIWNSVICGPCWPDSGKGVGVVALPPSVGQKQAFVSAFSSWGLQMSKASANPDVTFKVLDFMMQKDNELEVANYSGFVPPIPAYKTEKAYVDFAPATQTFFADLLPSAMAAPSAPEFKVWAFALAQATETLVLHPDTSVDDAISGMKTYVEGQIGPDTTEVRK